MWIFQLISWLHSGTMPHPSVVGIVRKVSHWFNVGLTWADRPHGAFSLYNVLKHMYVTSTCLASAAVLTILSVMLITHDDKLHAAAAQAPLREGETPSLHS